MSEPDSTHRGPRLNGTSHLLERRPGRYAGDCAAATTGGRSLLFELIPQIMHHKCVRAVLPNDVWRLLRKMTIDTDGERCGKCGISQQLECHEVWQYLPPPDAGGPAERHVMKLIRLRTLCHLCHLGKHIGYALRMPQQYKQVKEHLMELYRLPEPIFSQLEQIAFQEVGELNKAGVRALDLTHLNLDRYVWIRYRFGRPFTNDELSSCRQLSDVADLGG
jgi:hypothetical protein